MFCFHQLAFDATETSYPPIIQGISRSPCQRSPLKKILLFGKIALPPYNKTTPQRAVLQKINYSKFGTRIIIIPSKMLLILLMAFFGDYVLRTFSSLSLKSIRSYNNKNQRSFSKAGDRNDTKRRTYPFVIPIRSKSRSFLRKFSCRTSP